METDKMAFFIPTDYAPVIQELKQRLAMVETTIQVLEEIQNEEGVKPPAAGARPPMLRMHSLTFAPLPPSADQKEKKVAGTDIRESPDETESGKEQN